VRFYFYLVHLFLPNTASFQVPLYIEESDLDAATKVAMGLKNAFEKKFEIIVPPSAPILVVENINESRFEALILELINHPSVTIHLPVNFNGVIFQNNRKGKSLSSIQARIMVPGNEADFYSL